MASDGVLQGILSYDQRRGAAVPHMRVGPLPATISPCRGRPLAQAMALSLNGGDPQEVTLQAAMMAIGLQWEPLRRRAPAAHSSAPPQAEPPAVTCEWLAGAQDEPRIRKRRVSQLRLMGMTSADGVAGTVPRTVAQFMAAAAGDMTVVDAVEAALVAALAADGAGAAGGATRTQ
eukprot:5120707-Pleurochrysis_carterae.AAC.1